MQEKAAGEAKTTTAGSRQPRRVGEGPRKEVAEPAAQGGRDPPGTWQARGGAVAGKNSSPG